MRPVRDQGMVQARALDVAQRFLAAIAFTQGCFNMEFFYDAASDRTDLCVLDARDVAAGPIARVRLTQRIPFGFHANWFAAG